MVERCAVTTDPPTCLTVPIPIAAILFRHADDGTMSDDGLEAFRLSTRPLSLSLSTLFSSLLW
jgi:hypothetical protein